MSDRYVVLKGLLNTGDADAYAAAVAERQFLAEVQHPLIVEIYNFVLLRRRRLHRHGVRRRQLAQADPQGPPCRPTAAQYDPFPADQAIAYIVEILPALQLPAQPGPAVLRLQARQRHPVRRRGQADRPRRGAPGRRRPERDLRHGRLPGAGGRRPSGRASPATSSPSAARWRCWRWSSGLTSRTYATTFPTVDRPPLFQQYDSLYRVLAKATAANPNDRFQSVDELRDQLLGVLREVVAADGDGAAGDPVDPSALFAAPAAIGAELDWDELPALQVDPSDPAAAWLASVSIADPAGSGWPRWTRAPEQTVEVQPGPRPGRDRRRRLRTWRQRIIDEVLQRRPVGVAGGLARRYRRPRPRRRGRGDTSFNTVLGQVPGELAPKLALALACEQSGERQVAARAVPHLHDRRRQLRRAGRLRVGPDLLTDGKTSTSALGGARPGRPDQRRPTSRPAAPAPSCWPTATPACRRWPTPSAPSSGCRSIRGSASRWW